jgi:hypothetical protein
LSEASSWSASSNAKSIASSDSDSKLDGMMEFYSASHTIRN